ncbi:acyl-ACP--UDP-N-acetylglucosamine O-acyltransferase [Candidatus Palauibacter sp.]|uniref:acyl-ACP--UDP-N-acetylglucosamine O-acyltransferase n=1 Tax=Candidatus Palauibacter sp. TaxID=3101350 RepID=UPI003B5AC9F6
MTSTGHAPGRHATAVIDASARVAPSASVGPYAVIGPDVEIGERVRIGPHVYIERDTKVAEDVRIAKGAVLGSDPQDLKYAGERTFLEIGPRTVVREFTTLNRGTAAGGLTTVGADTLVMAYVHIAHDCRIGDHVVLTNGVTMAGHVEIGDCAIVGGLTGIQQFTRVGRHAMVGGGARLVRDVAPYTLVGGSRTRTYGINRIGLERRGFAPEAIRALQAAYRAIFRSGKPIRVSLDSLELNDEHAEVRELVAFIRDSARGITPTRARRKEDDDAE